MKKISVIVPVYNVEKYLGRCLESLTNQTLKDIEIIIVNDGSVDGSQAIIDNYKNKFPDIIKSFYVKNGGASKARNFALNHVTGEYIGFVDSDDYVSEEMYEKMYERAKENEADIVCCNYYRVLNEKKFTQKQFGNSKIIKDELFDKNIYESNLLFDEVPYLWNKIFKTEIIKENDFKFCDDLRIYEDLLFTYQAFSKANKISRVDKPYYYYTISRLESLTNILSEKRFDIFKVSERLVNYYKKIEKYEEVKEALLYVILKHIYVVLEKRTLKQEKKLKLKYINKVFDFLNAEFVNWKDNIYFELQDKNKSKYTSKLYWKLCTILGFNIVNKKNRLIRLMKKTLQFVFYTKPGNVYIKHYKKKINEKSILIFSQQGNNLSGNMFYILKELATNKLYDDYKIYVGYTNKNKEKFIKLLENYNILDKVKLIKNQTTRFAKILARSKYLFTDTSMPTYFIKRNEQIYLNTWHGTPLKTLGKSTENDFFDIANVQKNFVVSDYLLYPSEYMMDVMIEDYMLKGLAHNKIMLCGYPRNEIFLRDEEEIKEVKKKYELDNKTVIAYMPTWRGSVREVDIETQIEVAQKHIKEISEKLKENQILYVNMHPFIGNKLDISEYTNVQVFPKSIETYDFLSICDILITDYSSVFFDYAITNKKIILFAYDEEEYFKDRGVYLPFKDLPFPKVKNVQELIEEINLPIKYETKDFINKFCKYERKDISKQICERIFFKRKNDIKIVDMPKSDKENILIYAGDFKPDNNTRDFLNIVKNTKKFNYNYCVTYITKNLRPNKNIFKNIINKINFYGQLGNNTNISRLDTVIVRILKKCKKIYKIFKKRIAKINDIELSRIYQEISFKAVILYGDIDYKKIYQYANMKCKKILYIKEQKYFNKEVNKEIYNTFDYILTTNPKTYDIIKQYCGQEQNIRLIEEIKCLDDFIELI